MPNRDLYNQYVELCDKNDAFYSSSQTIVYNNPEGNQEYEIVSFSYRLASYTDFKENPLALECRGIGFCIDKQNGNIHLFARPFEKFFNNGENPYTASEVIDKLIPVRFMEKLDGSMVMVGKLPNGQILSKTKTSINSDQAIRATQIVNKNHSYRYFCSRMINLGYTPLFEYTSPDNCIVIRYPEERLTLIAIRNLYTGEYIDIHDPKVLGNIEMSGIPVVKEYDLTLNAILTLQENIKDSFEGWVVTFDNGQRVKFKTLDYVKKHRCKDSINNAKHLADLILSNGIDDVIPLFENDQATLDYINSFREKITYTYNEIFNEITSFYHDNCLLDRKTYALTAQSVLGGKMGLAMNLFLQRDMKLNEYIMKNELYKAFAETKELVND